MGLRIVALAGLLLTVASVSSAQASEGLDYSILRSLAVQMPDQLTGRGRTAPLDTLARQCVSSITGRESFEGREPLALTLDWAARPDYWKDYPFIKVNNRNLKESLHLPPVQSRFSYGALVSNQDLSRLVSSARMARERHENPSIVETEAERVADQLHLYESILQGSLFRLVPSAGGSAELWSAPPEASEPIRQAWQNILAAAARNQGADFLRSSTALAQAVRAVNPDLYPGQKMLALECHYNSLHPFRWAILCVILSAVALAVSFGLWPTALTAAGLGLLLAGLGLQSYGLVLRTVISGRAPLANMYESIVFVSWGLLLAAIVLEIIFRTRVIGLVAAVLGFIALSLADALPLDPHISQLAPVLRNTVWLAIHVIIILLAYSTLTLAMGIGHVLLGTMVFTPARTERARKLSDVINWTVEVGILLLTAGIIFGAAWANSAWGRYWGWDPKETWSLITMLGYLVMIHAVRFSGRYRDLVTAAGSIAGFLLVLMTYYGVNYLLGRGLHSYGFESGGGQWFAILFALVELGIIAGGVWIVVNRESRRADGGRSSEGRILDMAAKVSTGGRHP